MKSLPPPQTFAERQRYVYGILASAAGIFCGAWAVAMVALLMCGCWSRAQSIGSSSIVGWRGFIGA